MLHQHNDSYLFEAQKNILNIIFKLFQTSNFKMQQVQADHSTYKLRKLVQPKFLHPSHWGGGWGQKETKTNKTLERKNNEQKSNTNKPNRKEKKKNVKKKKRRQTGQKRTN